MKYDSAQCWFVLSALQSFSSELDALIIQLHGLPKLGSRINVNNMKQKPE